MNNLTVNDKFIENLIFESKRFDDYTIENDSIGSFECHGFRGVDKRPDYKLVCFCLQMLNVIDIDDFENYIENTDHQDIITILKDDYSGHLSTNPDYEFEFWINEELDLLEYQVAFMDDSFGFEEPDHPDPYDD